MTKYVIQTATHAGFITRCTKDFMTISENLDRAKKFNSYETAERFVERANENWEHIFTITRVTIG